MHWTDTITVSNGLMNAVVKSYAQCIYALVSNTSCYTQVCSTAYSCYMAPGYGLYIRSNDWGCGHEYYTISFMGNDGEMCVWKCKPTTYCCQGQTFICWFFMLKGCGTKYDSRGYFAVATYAQT